MFYSRFSLHGSARRFLSKPDITALFPLRNSKNIINEFKINTNNYFSKAANTVTHTCVIMAYLSI